MREISGGGVGKSENTRSRLNAPPATTTLAHPVQLLITISDDAMAPFFPFIRTSPFSHTTTHTITTASKQELRPHRFCHLFFYISSFFSLSISYFFCFCSSVPATPSPNPHPSSPCCHSVRSLWRYRSHLYIHAALSVSSFFGPLFHFRLSARLSLSITPPELVRIAIPTPMLIKRLSQSLPSPSISGHIKPPTLFFSLFLFGLRQLFFFIWTSHSPWFCFLFFRHPKHDWRWRSFFFFLITACLNFPIQILWKL